MKTGIVEWLCGVGSAEWRDWLDYLGMGVCPADEDELIDFFAVWRPGAEANEALEWTSVHGWRSLGQLRSERAVPVLIKVLDDARRDAWICEDLPTVFSLIGPASVDPLVAYLNDLSREALSRAVAADALSRIGQAFPGLRQASVSAIAGALERYTFEDRNLNSLLIWNLVELGERPAIPLIKEVFAARGTDDMWGDWEDVQVGLGLIPDRETPRQEGEWDQDVWDL